MNSTVYAPRPKRSNWGRVIYNILHDHTSKALTKEQIWDLVPQTMHVPHAKKKFSNALGNLVYRGYALSFGRPGSKDNKYRLAPRRHYDDYYGRRHGQQKKSVKKPKPALASSGNGRPTHVQKTVRELDVKIKAIQGELKQLEDLRQRIWDAPW